MIESKLEKKSCKRLQKDYGCICIKLISEKGQPDRLILMPGGFTFFIEFKVGNNTQSPHQKKWENDLTNLGYNYILAYTWEDIERFLNAKNITT